ncbi:PD40 domain-containing protein, partial [bacterium]|nr:PD40 domain-containing protein [bacterium]
MRSIIRLILLLLLTGVALAQFGQNKVQYVSHDWSYIQTAHFDIYFNEDGYELAVFAAHTADSSYAAICETFNHQLGPADRIQIIVYKSHNEFESTNISTESPSEGTGGFTEFFKNRVVVPFEGSWEDFRHVIHHELTHAVMLRMIYGNQILTSMARFQLPLWFIEGLAEYSSRQGWNREANMFLADAVLYGYLPDLYSLSYTMPYQGGQSVFCYLAERYGQEKISELLNRLQTMRRMEGALEHTFGIDSEQLSEEWQLYLRRTYWPSIASRQMISELGQPLTDHLEHRNFVNTSPAVSPGGERVAYLTDRNGYFDIYLTHIAEPE